MDELIRRSDAIEAIKDNSFALGDDYMEINGYGAIDDIRALPSADRPRGEWAEDPINKNIRQCSNCKASYTKDFLKSMTLYAEPKEAPNYCPNCGARMKGADDEVR